MCGKCTHVCYDVRLDLYANLWHMLRTIPAKQTISMMHACGKPVTNAGENANRSQHIVRHQTKTQFKLMWHSGARVKDVFHDRNRPLPFVWIITKEV